MEEGVEDAKQSYIHCLPARWLSCPDRRALNLLTVSCVMSCSAVRMIGKEWRRGNRRREMRRVHGRIEKNWEEDKSLIALIYSEICI